MNTQCLFCVDGKQHPCIAECAVLGLPDQYYGEAIGAVIVLSHESKSGLTGNDDDAPFTLPQLQGWAKERLAHYKVCTFITGEKSSNHHVKGAFH